MNRRDFLRGLLALPVVAIVTKHLPAPAPKSGLLGGGQAWPASDQIAWDVWLDAGTYKVTTIGADGTISNEVLYAKRSGVQTVKVTPTKPVASLAVIRTTPEYRSPDADANRARFFGA